VNLLLPLDTMMVGLNFRINSSPLAIGNFAME
jgi:hypothetical protein